MISKLDEEHIEIVLQTNNVGHLACCADGHPYVVPITYVYEDGCVYGHTNDGMKLQMLRKNPEVCFSVENVESIVKWRSVIGFGTFEELKGDEAAATMDLLFRRLAPLVTTGRSPRDEQTETFDQVARRIRLGPNMGSVYRIRLRDKTGRFEHI